MTTVSRFWLRFGDREVALPDGELLVGRGEGCHVRLVSPSVSRRHLRLLTVAEAVVAYDLESRNGSYLNGERITTPVKVKDGDILRVGTQVFAIREAAEDPIVEDEPDTWDMVVDQGAEADVIPPSSLRSTVEMDHATLIRAEFEKRQLHSSMDARELAVGRQRCAHCGRDFEVGQPFCPYCSSEPYSAPTYRTCKGCKALLSEQDARCPKCGLERPESSLEWTLQDDRRGGDRHDTEIHGLYVSSSLTFEGDVLNISRGGMFIEADLLDPVGTATDIVISVGERGRARFSGEVVHVVDERSPEKDTPPGMGIRFVEMAPRAKLWLESFLRQREA